MRNSYWTQELTTILINLVREHECLWERNLNENTKIKRQKSWQAVTKNLQELDSKLSVFDVKDRFGNLRRQYYGLLKRHDLESGNFPKSWFFEMLKFLPDPDPMKARDCIKWPHKVTERLLELLPPHECLWLPRHPDYRRPVVRDKAINDILKELQKIMPEMTYRMLKRKVIGMKGEYVKYYKTSCKLLVKKQPLWWFKAYSLMIKNAKYKYANDCEGNEEEFDDKYFSDEDDCIENFPKYVMNKDNLTKEVNFDWMNNTTYDEKSLKFNENNCRICLVSNADFNLKDSVTTEAPSYLECFERFFQIDCDVNENSLPKKICCNCGLQLMSTYELAEKALKSNKILKNYLLTAKADLKIKSEELLVNAAVEEQFNHFDEEEEISLINFKSEEILGNCESDGVDILDVKIEENLHNDITFQDFAPNEEKSSVQIDILSEHQVEGEEGIEQDQTNSEDCIDKAQDQKEQRKRYRDKYRISRICHICSKVLHSSSTLKNHLETHKENRERKYKCDTCGFQSLSLSSLTLHKRLHDPQRKRYSCEYCGKDYCSVGTLNVHKRIHTGDVFKCNLCPKVFCTKLELKTHLNIHLGNKNYECEYCGEKFYRNGRYNEHMARVHENVKLKCKQCGNTFKSIVNLKEHLYTHSGYPYICALCGVGRPSEYKCRAHISQSHKIHDADEARVHVQFLSSKVITLPRFTRNAEVHPDKASLREF